MTIHFEDFIMLDNEFLGFSNFEFSKIVNNNRSFNDNSLKIILKMIQWILHDRDSRKQKVYISISERFDDKTDDIIEGWFNSFEIWFHHREQIEGALEEHTQIEIAIQNIKSNISLDLLHHEKDYDKWMTWEAFIDHMREIYNSSEFEYTRFIYLRLITQCHNDSVNAYYERFHHMLIRQKKTMKYLNDQHLYHYIFIIKLKKNINIEILCLSESIRMKNMKFNKILELIKHIEQIVNCQSNAAKHNNNREKNMHKAWKQEAVITTVRK